jgi:hypothetical protein
MLPKTSVLPPKVHERCFPIPGGTNFRSANFANKDLVIACLVNRLRFTLESDKRALD